MKFKCNCCGEILNIHQSMSYIITYDKKIICNNCIAKNLQYKKCKKCGIFFEANNGESYCPDCTENIFKTPLNSYSTKVTGIFDNKNKINKCLNNRYYGLEMEFNNINANAMQLLLYDEYKNHKVYAKSDGSISYGVEVVTVPMDRHSVNTFLDRIKDKINLLNNNLTSNNAGLHVHVSKNSIPREIIRKLAILFNGKEEDDSINALYYLCGRGLKSNNLDGYYKAGWCEDIRGIMLLSRGHSCAFNNGNLNTVEFRIFKSTNDAKILKMYIDIVDSAIDFCSKNGLIMININNFMCYLNLTTKNDLIKERLDDIRKKFNIGTKVLPNPFSLNLVFDYTKFKKVNSYDELEDLLKKNNNNIYTKIKRGLIKDIIKGEKKCV